MALHVSVELVLRNIQKNLLCPYIGAGLGANCGLSSQLFPVVGIFRESFRIVYYLIITVKPRFMLVAQRFENNDARDIATVTLYICESINATFVSENISWCFS